MASSSKKIKIAVIGPIPRDHIITYTGSLIEKYGCITHPVVVLSNLFGEEATIYPVTHIRKKDETQILEIFKGRPGIDLSHISSEADRGDVINLRFLDQNERVKTMSAFMDPIRKEDLHGLEDSDAFLFLPVTDFEIALETLRFIKEKSKGLVIFDAHGQTKTVTTLGDRLFKIWANRDLWLPYIDILKMNLREAKCCAFKKRYTLEELEEDEPLPIGNLQTFATYCFNKGVKALYVTIDVHGCLVFTYENGDTTKVKETLVPAVPISNVVDTTGCGDSFAGGLTYGLLTKKDYVEAAKYANTIGAQCLQGPGFDCFKALEVTEKIVAETYREEQWS